MKSTSTAAAASGRAQNQAVAPATWLVVPIAPQQGGVILREAQPRLIRLGFAHFLHAVDINAHFVGRF